MSHAEPLREDVRNTIRLLLSSISCGENRAGKRDVHSLAKATSSR